MNFVYNLFHSEKESLKENARVAIVGAGITGITLATALGIVYKNITVEIFETKRELLHLQKSSHRFVHPHLYDWPNKGSSNKCADLPILDWAAGPAGEVVDNILRQFDIIERKSRSKIIFNQLLEIKDVRGVGNNVGCLLNGRDIFYDIAILCVGFGYESRSLTESYWQLPEVAAATRSKSSDLTFFISGNGDGALVDFILAGLNGVDISLLYEYIDGISDKQKQIICAAEDAIFEYGCTDICRLYDNIIDLSSPEYRNILRFMCNNLRLDARIIFHTRDFLFKKESAVINRIAAFLVIKSFESVGASNLRRIVGPIEGRSPYPNPMVIQGIGYSPDIRLLRFGPDADNDRREFLLNSVGPRHPDINQTMRCSPQLEESAKEWLARAFSSLMNGSQRTPDNDPATVQKGLEPAPLQRDLAEQGNLIRLFFNCRSKKYLDSPIKSILEELSRRINPSIGRCIFVKECYELVLMAKYKSDLSDLERFLV